MNASPHTSRLSKVQDEIEALLAGRPVDDFSTPAGYRSLVLLESALLNQVPYERSPSRFAPTLTP